MRRAALVGLLAVVACDNPEECDRLRAMRDEMRNLAARAKARQALAERIEKTKERHETLSKQAMAKLHLDRPEEALTEEFRRRAEAAEGVTMERITLPSLDSLAGENETVWRFELEDRPLKELFVVAERLSESPPLNRLSSLRRVDQAWILDVRRAVVRQVPIEPEPPEKPVLPDPDEVPSRFAGTCGAGELRAEIKRLRQEFEAHFDAAQKAAVDMQKSASLKGLYARSRALAERELLGRQVMAQLLTAVQQTRVPFLGVSSDGKAVLMQLENKPGVRARIQKALPASVLSRVDIDVEDGPDGKEKSVLALLVPNPAERGMRREGEDEHGAFMGAPSVEELQEAIRAQDAQGGVPNASTK